MPETEKLFIASDPILSVLFNIAPEDEFPFA
jgi:hypothetical protein